MKAASELLKDYPKLHQVNIKITSQTTSRPLSSTQLGTTLLKSCIFLFLNPSLIKVCNHFYFTSWAPLLYPLMSCAYVKGQVCTEPVMLLS